VIPVLFVCHLICLCYRFLQRIPADKLFGFDVKTYGYSFLERLHWLYLPDIAIISTNSTVVVCHLAQDAVNIALFIGLISAVGTQHVFALAPMAHELLSCMIHPVATCWWIIFRSLSVSHFVKNN